MPKIQITIDYDVNLKDYPGANTAKEAVWEDVRSLQDGHMSLAEFSDIGDLTYDVID